MSPKQIMLTKVCLTRKFELFCRIFWNIIQLCHGLTKSDRIPVLHEVGAEQHISPFWVFSCGFSASHLVKTQLSSRWVMQRNDQARFVSNIKHSFSVVLTRPERFCRQRLDLVLAGLWIFLTRKQTNFLLFHNTSCEKFCACTCHKDKNTICQMETFLANCVHSWNEICIHWNTRKLPNWRIKKRKKTSSGSHILEQWLYLEFVLINLSKHARTCEIFTGVRFSVPIWRQSNVLCRGTNKQAHWLSDTLWSRWRCKSVQYKILSAKHPTARHEVDLGRLWQLAPRRWLHVGHEISNCSVRWILIKSAYRMNLCLVVRTYSIFVLHMAVTRYAFEGRRVSWGRT